MYDSLIKNFRNLAAWQIINKVISIVYFSILTIKLGPYNYGLLALVLAIYEVASLGFVGINNGLQRYIAERHQKKVLIGGLKISVILSAVISFTLFVFRGKISEVLLQDINTLILLLISVLMVSTVKEVLINALFGIKKPNHFIVADSIFSVSKLILVSIFLYMGFGVGGVLIGLAAANALSGFAAFFMLRKIGLSDAAFDQRRLLGFSAKFLVIAAIYQMQPQVFIFFLTKLLGLLEVGYYKFLLNLSFISIVLLPQTLSFLIFPHITDLVHKEKKAELESLFNSSFRLAVYLSLLASAAFYFFSGFVIRWLFQEYALAVEHIPAFLLLAVAQSVGFISSTLMKATDSLMYYIAISLGALLLSVALSPILIILFGISGAAVSYAAIMLTLVVLLTIKMAKRTGIKLRILPSKEDLRLAKLFFKSVTSP